MKTRIIDNWEVELTNDKGDILTLKGQWYADFFKEYENKQLIIANVVGQSKQLVCDKCNEEGWITENKGDILEHRLCDCNKAK